MVAKRDLNAILSTVNIVAKKQEVCWHEQWTHSPQCLLKTHQVMIVAMQVACSQLITSN